MNPELNFIFSRRSIRQYTEKPVDDSMIRDLLEAAMAAPSAVAKDPWDFIIIRDRDMRAKIAEALPNGKMLEDAAVGFVICGDLNRAHDHQLSYLLQDCSAAIENLLLAANALGLGACWLGVHPRQNRVDHIRRLLSIPDHVIPVSAISVGWPGEVQPPRTRYRTDLVHEGAW